MAKKMSMFARLIYLLVGVAGVSSLVWFVSNLDKQAEMGFWGVVAFIILVIGGVNWLIVAITGKRSKDLFGLLKL